MSNEELVQLTKQKIPTIVGYDVLSSTYTIGEEARETGLIGKTTVFNFKPAFGAGDKEFATAKNYWVAVPLEEQKHHIETFSAKEAATRFLEALFKKIQVPEKIIVGEPAIRDQTWKENFRRHMREVFSDLGLGQIEFFPEPFAVYQYYRHVYKAFSVAKEAEIVLIIDIGGGTFNSCIIRTTEQGLLARGGATAVPLGLQAEVCGGSQIDKELFKIIVAKARKKGVRWKEDPIARIEAKQSPALLRIEDAKIRLSETMAGVPAAKIADDFSAIAVKVMLPQGECHPELDVEEILTGEDLKDVVREMWRRKYGKILIETVNEAKERLMSAMKISIDKIDKVLVAGGSSRLPFMKEEILLVLPTLVNKSDIFITSDISEAVAYGIACECREQVKREPKLSVGRIAPCILNDLFVGFRARRKDPVQIPRIKFKGSSFKNGQLLLSPFETNETILKYEVELPFDVSDRLFYVFTDKPIIEESDVLPLNIGQDVISVPKVDKLLKKCELHLEITPSGLIRPLFKFRGKGAASSKQWHDVRCPELYIPDLQIKEGNAYVGIDFGNSNSYMVRFLSIPHDITGSQYPDLSVSRQTKDRLRELELRIAEYRTKEFFSKDRLIDHAKKHALEVIFHSNKIEGNPLTKGETEAVLSQIDRAGLSEKELEAKNLESAYYWMLDNYESLLTQPEAFVREIHRLIVKDVKKDGGQYRIEPVTISGANFVPPLARAVSGFMQQFGDEVKKKSVDRSPVEFATALHTKLVWVHPFSDGNGRTARIVVNACLLANNLPVVVVNFADRERYIHCLNESNKGDLSTLIEFFLECFDQQLEDFRPTVLSPIKAANAITEDKANVITIAKPEISTIDRAIREVGKINTPLIPPPNADTEIMEISEIGTGELDNPLASIMKVKLLEENRIKEARYEAWKQSLLTIPAEFNTIIEDFNSNEEYRAAGFKIRLQEYDVLTPDKYDDISAGKGATKTWFLGIEISGPHARERMMFFFNRASNKLTEDIRSSKVGLIASRLEGSRYIRLDSEPISLREIGYKDGQLLFFVRGGGISSGNVRRTLSVFLAEVIKSYIS